MKQKLKMFHSAGRIEAGCDEAGRGCLAGPVVAAAVILPEKFFHPLLNDSKQMTESQRNTLRPVIEQSALAWAVAEVSNIEIDEINILNASFLGMHRALDQLKTIPDHILVDGNRFKSYRDIKHTCVIKGDSKFASIAAASVLAKTYRDELMKTYHEEFGQYNWIRNKGYPTVEHRKAISTYGPTALHRMSFTLLPKQLEIEFK